MSIGKKFGISRQAVHQLRVKYGIESSIANNPERDKKILKAYKKKPHGPTVAKRFGLSEARVYAIIRKGKAKKRQTPKRWVQKRRGRKRK